MPRTPRQSSPAGIGLCFGRLPMGSVLVLMLTALAGQLRANLPPSGIALLSDTVRAQQPAGTIVGILRASDPDQDDTHRYALVDGVGADDNDLFAIAGDTIRTGTSLDVTGRRRFSIRVRAEDGGGAGLEKRFWISLTPPSFVDGLLDYFSANPAVSNASLATFDKPTLDYFWVYQNSLAATGAIEMDTPANTPADDATNGTVTVYLSATETARILAAKTAHAVWLDKNELVPWRLGDFLAGHSEAVLPCVGRVLPHGDHVYSADLTATPVTELMPTFQFYLDNLNTPPCAGDPHRISMRHQALRGAAYPTPTILRGVQNPASYGYASAAAFLAGYAGWDQGLTQEELGQAAAILLTGFSETRRLTVPTTTSQGYGSTIPRHRIMCWAAVFRSRRCPKMASSSPIGPAMSRRAGKLTIRWCSRCKTTPPSRRCSPGRR